MNRRGDKNNPNQAPTSNASSSCDSGCCCGGMAPSRRQVLQAMGGAALAISSARIFAGPFSMADFEKLVPADKKLSPQWLKSLTQRGEPTAYRGDELHRIGMPVGGIGAGQLYLGGDGRLWHWDIFNKHFPTGARHYAEPMAPSSPLDQGFAIRVTSRGKVAIRPLDQRGFSDITFVGQYPIGRVEYRDKDLPVEISLEAFSPFIPLETDDSSLPATVMQYTIRNTSDQPVQVEVGGWLENAVGLYTGAPGFLMRRNRVRRENGFTCIECAAEADPQAAKLPKRPEVIFEDFEKPTYEGWTATGTAFGDGPIERAKIPKYQGDVGGAGKRVVNTHNARQGEDVSKADAHKGTLTSREFVIERNYVRFFIGGGAHKGKTCLNLLIDGKVVLSATGANDNRMKPALFDVRRYQGKTAKFQIVDDHAGAWGNIGVDHIVLTDDPGSGMDLRQQHDFGTLCLAVLGEASAVRALAALPDGMVPPGVFAPVDQGNQEAVTGFGQKLSGSIAQSISIAPGEKASVTFIVAWHFPNLRLDRLETDGRWYAKKFSSAVAVVNYLAKNFDRLAGATRLWRDTWYDSTLPHWLLDRTLLNASILASSTSFRFGNGRFYGWEGVGCCPGTCTHVWQYEQAMGRLFPQLDINLREYADFNPSVAFKPDGMIDHRGEFKVGHAIDGQAGTILRALRDHQTSADEAFLKRNWASIKKAVQWMIEQDGNGDGILEGAQHNTLDAAWFGPVAWLSGMYLAALRAGEEMARDAGDEAFASQCRGIFEAGRKKLPELLFNGEYFINKPDPAHLDAINSGSGCHIDQVLGQSWAFQVGLGRVLPEQQTLSALRALWRYNFTPDVGPYRQVNKPGRWYAMAGEGGLLMCTFPRADWDYFKAAGKGNATFAGYFNECMNGFEHQVAGHMIWEGMVTEGLAIERALHDRYHGSRRNPWNEVECGDHYARSMASYGVFTAACGFEYHGPHGHMGVAPRVGAENFKAAFTAAQGWGTYAQQARDGKLQATLSTRYGRLALKTLALESVGEAAPRQVAAKVKGQAIACSLSGQGKRLLITFDRPLRLESGDSLDVVVS